MILSDTTNKPSNELSNTYCQQRGTLGVGPIKPMVNSTERKKLKSIDTYVDVFFAGIWNILWSNETSSMMYRTGYVIIYANFPIVLCSKLQTEISLSTIDSAYISLRDNIPLIWLLHELHMILSFPDTAHTINCTVLKTTKDVYN